MGRHLGTRELRHCKLLCRMMVMIGLVELLLATGVDLND